MIRRKFIVKRHEEFGSLGLCPFDDQYNPALEPLAGMTIAHDILEHFPNAHGTAEEEYMALGATMLVRSQWSERRGTMEENLASEFATVYKWSEQHCLPMIPVNKKIRNLDEEIEETLRRTRRFAIMSMESEILYDDDETEESVRFLEEYADAALDWIRVGYRKATRRYRNVPAIFLGSVFKQISDGVELALKRAVEGQLVKISVNVSREHAEVDALE